VEFQIFRVVVGLTLRFQVDTGEQYHFWITADFTQELDSLGSQQYLPPQISKFAGFCLRDLLTSSSGNVGSLLSVSNDYLQFQCCQGRVCLCDECYCNGYRK
jgi:hypothetical protein